VRAFVEEAFEPLLRERDRVGAGDAERIEAERAGFDGKGGLECGSVVQKSRSV
jgi:hypothetical protein